MDSARWDRIQTLFHDAADLPPSEQQAYLATACGADDELLAEVLAMLEEDARSSLLDSNVAQVAGKLLDEAVPVLLATQRFGPYRITRLLGEGGMGVVYLAERDDLKNVAAIKVLRDAWLSPARRERFLSEQRTLAQLNHPSIARLYDAGTLAEGTPWFVMEYVEGAPLTEYCGRHDCAIAEKLRLFRLVCEAVQYAHQHAVIHRDLKPSNILVKEDGTVRLLDFGIAKQIENLDDTADQTRTGLRLMTPAYAAPEQIRGERIGVHTDVYALGVILYELLAGRLPFDLTNLSPAQAEVMIVNQEPQKPSTVAKQHRSANQTLRSAESADLDVLCLTAMHKDPARRYRSVEALIRDVDHFLGGEPLEAQPDTMHYRLGKFVRRNRRAVAAAAVVTALVIGLVVFFLIRLTAARDAALAQAARTERIQEFMTDLFEGGDKEAGPADTLRVVTLLDRGLQQARALDRDPTIQSDLYETLGSIYQKLGKLDQSDRLLRETLDRRKKLFGPDSPQVAESLVALGELRSEQARFDEAERLVRQGLEIEKRKLAPSDPAIATGTLALGRVLEGRGAYGRAIQVLEDAVRLRSTESPGTADLGASLTELANAHFYAGHYDVSESLNQRAVALYRRLYGEHHPLVADALINLGAIQFERGNYVEAARLDSEALDITRAWYGNDHPETASAMNILARALIFEKRLDEAKSLLEQALAIQERAYGPVHPRVASALNELGSVALRRGELDEAEARFRRMADIYRAVYGDKHYLIAVALSNLASVYMERHEWARAETLYRQVVQRFTVALSADHSYTAIARIKLGRALLGERHYAEAQQESLAGYQILSKQAGPSVSWLQDARADLAAEYEALHQPEKAEQMRAELTSIAGRK
ncbi:MAG TPA: serine/threonine-protein kinase [Bryobacteraceae bacterium]|nr:serine/threonine-protein kinase [Bryobacteraceae bacterium]